MTVRFEPAGPYEVDETDTPFARPDGAELLARLYRPRVVADRPLGAVVHVHGGAWGRLDRTADAILCGALAASGLVVVALDFRQAPDHRFPVASADVAAGVRYARAHAAQLHVDPARIGLLGSSSGAQLALLHAVRPDAPESAGTPIVRRRKSRGSMRRWRAPAAAIEDNYRRIFERRRCRQTCKYSLRCVIIVLSTPRVSLPGYR